MRARLYAWWHSIYHLFEAVVAHLGHGHTPWGI